MGFVDQSFSPWATDGIVARPVEGRVLHHALDHERRGIATVESKVVAGRKIVTPKRIVPLQRTGDLARIRVQQQLVGVEAMALLRLVGAVGAIAVELPGLHIRHVAGEDRAFPAGHFQPRQFLRAVRREQAQFHGLGILGKDREMGPVPGEFGTQLRLLPLGLGESKAHVLAPPALWERTL